MLKKIVILCAVISIVGCVAYAQEATDFGKISLENGSFLYHGLKFERINILTLYAYWAADHSITEWEAVAQDTTSLTYANGNILVITKKNGWVFELPLSSVSTISYNANSKRISVMAF